MTKAKVSELKARLSAYLAEVRGGGEVLVYDRTTPIARLVPFNEDADDIRLMPESSAPATLRRLKGVRPAKPGRPRQAAPRAPAGSVTIPTIVKTLDAIHLASALVIRERRGVELIFCTHDVQQTIAARALGFETRES